MDVAYKIEDLTPKRRVSHDIIFFGGKGSYKTLSMTAVAFFEGLEGRAIASNYRMYFDESFDYTYINSFEDVENLYNQLVILDDAENWVSSKFVKADQKKDVLKITTNLGKRRCDSLISCKNPLEVDKTIRRPCDFYVHCVEYPEFVGDSYDDFIFYRKHLDFNSVLLECIDPISNRIFRRMILRNIDLFCELYDTTEEIKGLKKSGMVGIKKNTRGVF